jgi:hypothetical protein
MTMPPDSVASKKHKIKNGLSRGKAGGGLGGIKITVIKHGSIQCQNTLSKNAAIV